MERVEVGLERFGNEIPRSSTAVPAEKSPDEGRGKDRSQCCCAFRHPAEPKAVLDAWESTLTDAPRRNADRLWRSHVSAQAAPRAALSPRVLVGSSWRDGISLAAECHLPC